MRTNSKHVAAAIRKALARGDFQLTEDGLILPREGIHAAGTYYHSVNGEDLQIDHNLLPDAGILSILNVYFGGTSKISAFYIALFSGAVNPGASLTAANFAATMTEITSNTEGYSNVTRPQFTPSAAAAGTIGNLTNKANFAIVSASAGQIIVNGAALVSDNTKGGTAGVLPSCSRFANTRTLFNGDNFEVGYTVTLTG